MANDTFAPPVFDGEDNKHHSARSLAEAALRAEKAGDQEKADALFRQAEAADPSALEAVLLDHRADLSTVPATPLQDDREIAAMSRTMEPERRSPPPEALDESY